MAKPATSTRKVESCSRRPCLLTTVPLESSTRVWSKLLLINWLMAEAVLLQRLRLIPPEKRPLEQRSRGHETWKRNMQNRLNLDALAQRIVELEKNQTRLPQATEPGGGPTLEWTARNYSNQTSDSGMITEAHPEHSNGHEKGWRTTSSSPQRFHPTARNQR